MRRRFEICNWSGVLLSNLWTILDHGAEEFGADGSGTIFWVQTYNLSRGSPNVPNDVEAAKGRPGAELCDDDVLKDSSSACEFVNLAMLLEVASVVYAASISTGGTVSIP